MFSGSASPTVAQDIPSEEMISEDKLPKEPESNSSTFFDEPDAFQ